MKSIDKRFVMRVGACIACVLPFAPACGRDASKTGEGGDASGRPAMPAVSFLPTASIDAPPNAAPAIVEPSAPKSTVKLLDPGREPRRAIRYKWRPDRAERMAIELSTRVSAEGGGVHQDIALAPLEIALSIEPQSVGTSGDLHFSWRVTSAALGAADASSPPQVAQGWSAQLAPVEHLSGSAIVSAHGVSRGIAVDTVAPSDGGAESEMVVQVVQMLRDVAAPLPEEPVGPGARWQKISVLDAKNGHATQTDTFTLAELHGDTGELDDVLAQTASPQTLTTPDGMLGARGARMDQLLTSGQSKIRFDLGRIVPQSTLDGTTSMALSAPSNRVNMVMRLGVSVRGSVP